MTQWLARKDFPSRWRERLGVGTSCPISLVPGFAYGRAHPRPLPQAGGEKVKLHSWLMAIAFIPRP